MIKISDSGYFGLHVLNYRDVNRHGNTSLGDKNPFESQYSIVIGEDFPEIFSRLHFNYIFIKKTSSSTKNGRT